MAPSVTSLFQRLVGQPPKGVDPSAECFRRHFEAKLGPKLRTRTIYRDLAAPMIDIETYRATWDPSVRAITSVGLSAFTATTGHRFELMLLVDQEHEAAERAFARIVGLLATEPDARVVGEVYDGWDSFGPIAKRHGKLAMVLSDSTLDVPIFDVQCQDGTGGHVFLLVPITAAERDYLAERGWPALSERLLDTDPSDTSRPSAI